VLKCPVFGDYFISETGLGATTFVPLGSLGHLRLPTTTLHGYLLLVECYHHGREHELYVTFVPFLARTIHLGLALPTPDGPN
jgi:hypothetical protein